MTDNQTEITVVNDRYELREKLGEGGMGTVHLAYDRITDETIALKQVKVSRGTVATGLPEDTERRIEELRTRLTHEFRILAGMRHPHIISVLDYGFTSEGTPFYTMEYLSDAEMITEVGKSLEPRNKILFLIQVLQALEYLHRRGVLHRDLKPENILVQNGQVKVLDFGISLMMEQTQDADQAGTVAYMAPETLTGRAAPSVMSDLWAVGIIGFELFSAGLHPFEDESTGHFINNILFQDPDYDALDISTYLTDILTRLLQKDPADRYQSAQSVINMLLPHVGASLVTETTEIRESFLQTARFTGREDVLAAFDAALLDARTNKGKLHLVAGPSGIGKSRVLDELRVKALVSGFNVVRGYTQEEADQPFALWHPVMRRLCLMATLSDEQAAVLKLLVPDISKFLKRDIPDAPDLEDATAAKRRLFDVADHLVRAIERPLLILLEDLQWADDSSLDLLAYLARFVPQHNVLIVASYRNDITPDLAHENFKDVDFDETVLKRLNEDHIRKLAVSILGAAGERASVVDLLNRESNGNAFFLIETIRALAEHSGQLEQIGVGDLPDKIFPDGIHDIVQRRLSNVNEEQIAVLRLAAIGGYELDVALIDKLTPDDAAIESWLTVCANYAILEVEDGLWRFTQRQLRDGVLKDIPEDKTKDLHRKMAVAKTDFYNNGDAHEASIAHHWEEAEDLEQAAIWYLKAGQVARKSYATTMAIEHYEKAKSYLPGSEEHQDKQLDVAEGLGKLYLWQAKNEESEKNYNFMLSLAHTRNDDDSITQALLGLCEVNRNMGKYEKALDYAKRVQERERNEGDMTSHEMVAALAHQAFCLNRLRRYDEARTMCEDALKLATENDMTTQIVRLQSILGILYFRLGDKEKSEEAMKQSLELAEELGDRRDIAIRNNNLGELYRYFGRFENAAKHLEQALKIYIDIGAQDGWLITTSNLAGAYNGLNKHEEAEGNIRQILDKLDDPYSWPGMLEAAQHFVEALYAQKKYVEALETTQEWVDKALEAGNKASAGFAWYFAGNLARMIGIPFSGSKKDYTASECFEAAAELFSQPHPPLLRDWALHEADMGNMERALELKAAVLPLLTDANELEDIQKLNEHIPT